MQEIRLPLPAPRCRCVRRLSAAVQKSVTNSYSAIYAVFFRLFRITAPLNLYCQRQLIREDSKQHAGTLHSQPVQLENTRLGHSRRWKCSWHPALVGSNQEVPSEEGLSVGFRLLFSGRSPRASNSDDPLRGNTSRVLSSWSLIGPPVCTPKPRSGIEGRVPISILNRGLQSYFPDTEPVTFLTGAFSIDKPDSCVPGTTAASRGSRPLTPGRPAAPTRLCVSSHACAHLHARARGPAWTM